jgi:hypothetical protein
LRNGWHKDHLEVLDISKALGGKKVTDIKRMSLPDKVTALCKTLQRVETEWFDKEKVKPDVIVVEVQHNANPEMKAVAMAVLAFLHRSMPDTELRAITGVHKLKLCEVLGFSEGSGLASRRSRGKKPKGVVGGDDAADTDTDENENEDGAEPLTKKGFRKVADKWVRTKQGCLDKYYDNKHRSMLALKTLLPTYKTAKGVKCDDVADALLQALWILWEHVEPRKPRKQPTKGLKRPPKESTETREKEKDAAPKRKRSGVKPKAARECFIDLSLTPAPAPVPA